MIDESSYRRLVDEVLRHIDAAFEDIDPDLAESDFAQGSLVVTFAQSRKLIVSPQAPARQIWVAFRDRAWHMSLSDDGRWMDDRGAGVELMQLIASVAREQGVALELSSPSG